LAVVSLAATACGVDAPAPVAPSSITVGVTGAPASQTLLAFASDPGDYIGAGQTRTYYLGDGTWNARFDNASRGHVSVSITNFQQTGNSFWWSIDFAAPRGQPLTPGTYEAARRYPFQPDSQPGLSFSGSGRGCNTLTGRFVVTDIQIGPANSVDRFAASFEQNCEGSSPALRGEVRIATNPWR
jgi:hypothetical protein